MKLIAQIFVAVAVASANAKAEELASYSGYYVSIFEYSNFVPNGSKERWWLTGKLNCPGISNGSSDIMAPGPTLHIVIRASVSEKGHHGHLGLYSREIKVSETVSCREIRKDEKPNFEF